MISNKQIRTIDGAVLKNMFICAANALSQNREFVDSLNVFPVPDGDTGTNMSYTIVAAAKGLDGLANPDTAAVAKVISDGSLRGARGNSGVILSQLFRGFAKGLEGTKTADVFALSNAFEKAAATAYKAVMKPKEGTILTIARALGEKAVQISQSTQDVKEFFDIIYAHGLETLSKTTSMLPELARAKVVDAGGKGLMFIVEGMIKALSGDDIKLLDIGENKGGFKSAFESSTEIEYGYCTELFIKSKDSSGQDAFIKEFQEYLSGIGDSIIVVGGELIKLHVHSNNPGSVLEYALKHGELSDIKIENMRIQHSNLLNSVEHKPQGFVCVSMGEGLDRIFLTLGADRVIQGGQSMNPSTDEILNAMKSAECDHVIILPNNKNIILAAKQAAELYSKLEGKSATVIETTTIPQGISALMAVNPVNSIDENVASMNEAVQNIKTASVTYAVRESGFVGGKIEEGDYLFMQEGKIVDSSKDISGGTKKLILSMVDEDSIVSIYYGADINEESAEKIKLYIENEVGCEVSVYNGGQPLYYYIISVE